MQTKEGTTKAGPAAAKLEQVLPLEHIEEYDSAAKWCADRGLKGEIGDPLPANMATDGALYWIQLDPESFQKRVREFAYAKAMSNHPKAVAEQAGDFTAGPWQTLEMEIRDRYDVCLASVSYGAHPQECEANARLIAAAPELLQALNDLFEHCAMTHKYWGENCNSKQADMAIKSAHAAIYKATKAL